MTQLRAAAAAVEIPTQSDSASGSLPPNQEAPLRVSALALEADERVCFVSADTLVIPADILARAEAEIVSRGLVPLSNLLICATHTHSAPCTIDILGAHRDAAFCARLEAALVEAVAAACQGLDAPAADAQLSFAQSQEATVGCNSRYLLKDGTIAWYNYPWASVVRPTGPYDPDLPVFAVRRSSRDLVSVLFNHSVHNIGALNHGMLSPAFYGLAAQELERRHGGTALFLPGAFGSAHNTGPFGSTENIHAIPTAELVHRVVAAVERGLAQAEGVDVSSVRCIKRRFTYHTRHFDEDREEAAVRYWSETYTPDSPTGTQDVFRAMRAEMAPLQGEQREATLQVIRLGDVALVGVPAELFARLGLEIRRRSPFRHTYVIGLANGTIGYVGDREAYDLGGYQLWAGMHSPSAPGTGEVMVDQALEMLQESYSATQSPCRGAAP